MPCANTPGLHGGTQGLEGIAASTPTVSLAEAVHSQSSLTWSRCAWGGAGGTDEGEDEAGFVPGDASEGNEGKGPEEAAELWRKWPQREGAGEENRGLLMHAQDDQEGLQVAGAPQAPPAQLQVHQDLEARETVTPRGGEAWEEQATASGSALPSDVPVVDRDGVARPSGTQGAPGQGEEKAPMSWANPWARKGSLAQRQTGALLSIRFTAYR